MERIKVVSVGSGALNALNHMVLNLSLPSVDYIAIDTNYQALVSSVAPQSILLRKGSFELNDAPESLESRKQILKSLQGATTVIIIVMLGGNTGSNASLLVADCVKEIGAVSIAMVSIPLSAESRARQRRASESYEKLKASVNTIIKIYADKIMRTLPPDSSREDILYYVDENMRCTIKNLVDMDEFQTLFKKAGEIIFETDEDYPDD